MKAYIKAVSYHLPKQVVTNQDLVRKFPEWTVDKVTKKIGVEERHVVSENETASDLAVCAAEKMFKVYDITPKDIDFILFCTQSPDYILPTTACIIQDKLGVPTTAGALDFNLGCSGYIYGLSLAKGLIYAGIAKNILLLTAETYSKYIHPQDKGNQSIFGDAAAATLVSIDGFAEIGDFSLGTDGSGARNLIVESGAARISTMESKQEFDENGAIHSEDHLYMNGTEIFNFTLSAVPTVVESTLLKNNLPLSSIDQFVFHQANKFMLNTIRKICGIDKDKFYIKMANTGNTVSSTIPIALVHALDENVIQKDNNVLIAGFGVGYSWGGCILKF